MATVGSKKRALSPDEAMTMRMLIEHAPYAIAVLDTDLNYVALSERWAQLYEVGSVEALIGRHHPDIDTPVNPPWREAFDRALNGTPTIRESEAIYNSAGQKSWVRWSCHPWFFDPQKRHALAGIVLRIEDVTEQIAMSEALGEAKERLEIARRAADQILWEMWPQTGELDSEQLWVKLGYKANEVPHTMLGFEEKLHPDDRTPLRRTLAPGLSGMSRYFNASFRLRAKDDSYRWFEAHGAVLRRDESGKPELLVGLMSDVSARKQVEEQLIAAKQLAEDASRAKSAFVANMSHELRTPLTGVTGMLDLLQDAELSQSERGYLQAAQDSARTLLSLVNDILDLSRLESGATALTNSDFSLSNLLDEVVRSLHFAAAEKNLTLKAEPVATEAEWINADPLRLRQILLNLVGNAIKFTQRGSVRIEADLIDGDNGGKMLRCAVVDTGCGIKSDMLERIFERFRQGDGSLSRSHGGTGLGLAICKEITSLMQGRIEVESEFGHGSRFTIFIPCTPVQKNVAPKNKAVTEEKAVPKTGRLLLAEDNEINQLLIRALLERRGHHVTVAKDGIEALERLAGDVFDLVLMDIQMPRMDGLAATAKIRAMSGEVRDVPVIAITAHAMTGQRETYLAAGMNAYVSKPIDAGLLYETIDKFLEKQG